MYHGLRLLFSPDAAPGAAAPPADAPATPASDPAPAAAPAAPPSAPATPATPAAPPTPGVDPGMTFDVMGTDGVERSATLQEMADAYSASKTSPQVTPEQLAELELYQKAVAGDAEAQRAMIDKAVPKAPAAPADPASEALVTANEQIKELKNSIAPIQQQYDQIADARGQTQFKQIIESCKAQMPFTAQHPQGAAIAFEKYKQARTAAKAQGTDLSSHPRHQQVVSAIFQHTEAELAAHAKAFAGFTPPAAAAPQASPITATDDQGNPVAPQLPPGVQMLNGVPVDQYGHPVQIPSVTVDGGTIPSTGVGQAGSAAPGAEGQIPSLDKPFTEAELLKNMQARNAEQTT